MHGAVVTGYFLCTVFANDGSCDPPIGRDMDRMQARDSRDPDQ